MQQLTDALAARLDVRFRANATVAALEPRAGGGWHVVYDSVDGARDRAGVYADRADAALGNGAIDADAVVLAMPSYAAADLVAPFDGDLASSLRAIPYATMRVAGVAYRSRDVPAPLDGFGFLAARGAGLRILGALFTSTIFPDQAPPDTAYFRVFLGGAVDPNVLELDEAALRDVVRNDLRTALGITAEPVAFHERTWVRAIPQYGLRHRALLASIDERVRAHPGLALAGNAYRGLGLGDVVRDAFAVADGLAPRDPASA
jgi:oxygen-dependent protoporphyrinogen oxidase